MSKIELTECERNILNLCNAAGKNRISRKTFGKELNRLVIAGLLSTNGSDYKTTNAGREAMKARKK